MLLCEHCSGHLNEHAFIYCYAFYNGILPTPHFGVATQQQRINNNSNIITNNTSNNSNNNNNNNNNISNRATKVAAMGNIFLFNLTVQGLLVGRHSLQITLLLIPGVALVVKLNGLFLPWKNLGSRLRFLHNYAQAWSARLWSCSCKQSTRLLIQIAWRGTIGTRWLIVDILLLNRTFVTSLEKDKNN